LFLFESVLKIEYEIEEGKEIGMFGDSWKVLSRFLGLMGDWGSEYDEAKIQKVQIEVY
jgi:hypothetical protein